jgi:hypothetical protein
LRGDDDPPDAQRAVESAAAARTRIKDLIPEGASVFTAASETLRLSGIDEDINTSGRYQAVKPLVRAIDRVTGADDIRRLLASPDVVVGSIAALTETGSLVVASASGSQLPAYAGGARAIWVVGAQKVVPDLSTALRRVEDHALPLESARAQVAYGQPSAINRLLVSTQNPTLGAAPSCCSAKPSDSETTRSTRRYRFLMRPAAKDVPWISWPGSSLSESRPCWR